MRRPLEALARAIATEPGTATICDLAKKHGESAERILDAMCVLKLLEVMGALEEAPITYISA